MSLSLLLKNQKAKNIKIKKCINNISNVENKRKRIIDNMELPDSKQKKKTTKLLLCARC